MIQAIVIDPMVVSLSVHFTQSHCLCTSILEKPNTACAKSRHFGEHQSEVNGEKYYYQQIVFNKAIFKTTFIAEKGNYSSWRGNSTHITIASTCRLTCNTTFHSVLDYFEHLVFIGPENGGISVSRSYNISNLSDVSDFERGPEIARYELNVMYENANSSQKRIFNRINIELANNSATFVSGAAGTGKSYLLKMLEKHYKIEGYKVTIKHICFFYLVCQKNALTPSSNQ